MTESNSNSAVCPTKEELSAAAVTYVPCHLPDCKMVFRTGSNLRFHLERRHGIKDKKSSDKPKNQEFFCPEENCKHSFGSFWPFKTMYNLKQHYSKVHKEKRWTCSKCNLKFGAKCFLDAHIRDCGLTFKCSCQRIYNSYSSLQTHAKRSNHEYDKRPPIVKKTPPVLLTLASNRDTSESVDKTEKSSMTRKQVPLAPMPSKYQIALSALLELSTRPVAKVDIGVQSEWPDPPKRKHNSPNKSQRKKHCTGTQTATTASKKTKQSCETQTTNQFLCSRLKRKESTASQCSIKRVKSTSSQCSIISVPKKKLGESAQWSSEPDKTPKQLDTLLSSLFQARPSNHTDTSTTDLWSAEDFSAQTLVDMEDFSTQTLVSTEDFSAQTLVNTENFSSQTLARDFSAQTLVSTGDFSTQTLVSTGDFSTQTFADTGDFSTQTLSHTGDFSAQTLVSTGDFSTQTLNDSSDLSVPTGDFSTQTLTEFPVDPGDWNPYSISLGTQTKTEWVSDWPSYSECEQITQTDFDAISLPFFCGDMVGSSSSQQTQTDNSDPHASTQTQTSDDLLDLQNFLYSHSYTQTGEDLILKALQDS